MISRHSAVPRQIKSTIVLLSIVLWVSAPVAAIWWLSRTAERVELVEEKPQITEIVPNTDPVEYAMTLVVEFDAGPEVNAPSWSGLVTQVLVSPGMVLTSGTAIASVDGVSRLAIHTPAPFYRPLTTADEGDDVKQLNTVLKSLSLPAGSGSTFTSATASGVSKLAEKLGASPTVSFDPSWIVWLPAPEVAVAEVNLAAGRPAPSAGTAIFKGSNTIKSAYLADSTEEQPTEDSSPASEESAKPSPSATDKPVPRPAPSGARIVLDGSQIPLAPDSMTITGEGLTLIGSLAPSNEALVPVKAIVDPASGQWRVPPAAVYSSSLGDLCVVRVRGNERLSVHITVLGSTYSSSVISGELQPTDKVIVSPRVEDRSCA